MGMWQKDQKTGEPVDRTAEFERLFSLVIIKKDDHVLDVGCGSGVLVPHILKRLGAEGRLWELDYAEKMITVNRRLHADERITFVVADIHNAGLKTDSLDLVLCFSCFPHFDDKPEAMRRITGALKKNGCVAIAHFLSSSELNEHHKNTAAVMQSHMPGPDEIKRLFTEAGLKLTCFTDQPGFFLAMGHKNG